jgi:hypothetical protein
MNQFLTFTKPRSIAMFNRILGGISLAMKRYEATPYPEDKIEDTQTSNCFRSMVDAMLYYGWADYHDIKQKEADGLIQIGWPSSFHSWNKENRAIIFTPEAMKQKAAIRFGDERRVRILHVGWDIAELINIIKSCRAVIRSRGMKCQVQEIKTKKALLELVLHEIRPWTEKLPYCGFGKPYYTSAQHDEQEQKEVNNRLAHFSFKGKEFWLVRLRKVRNSPCRTHWGMDDAPSQILLFDKKFRLVSTGSLFPSKKEILTAIQR